MTEWHRCSRHVNGNAVGMWKELNTAGIQGKLCGGGRVWSGPWRKRRVSAGKKGILAWCNNQDMELEMNRYPERNNAHSTLKNLLFKKMVSSTS